MSYLALLEVFPHVGLNIFLNWEGGEEPVLAFVFLLIRWIVILLEYINKRSGVEFWNILLNKEAP